MMESMSAESLFGSNLPRVKLIKTQYDPSNMFSNAAVVLSAGDVVDGAVTEKKEDTGAENAVNGGDNVVNGGEPVVEEVVVAEE